MTRLARAGAPVAALAALVLALAGCAAPAGDEVFDAAPEEATLESPERTGDVPQECGESFPLAVVPADIADVELQPADWPAPPPGAVLCLTTGSFDDSTESASYATEAAFADVLAHYESGLAGYELSHTDGAENGTGYDALDGWNADTTFQIRERDGGFVIVFARGSAEG